MAGKGDTEKKGVSFKDVMGIGEVLEGKFAEPFLKKKGKVVDPKEVISLVRRVFRDRLVAIGVSPVPKHLEEESEKKEEEKKTD